jgi:glutamate--cysteine ligase
LVKGFDAETREGLRIGASVSALNAEAGGVKLADLARAAVGLSHAGLFARGQGEEAFLAPVVASLKNGVTQADLYLSLYNGDWGGDLSRIYAAAKL